MLARWDASSQVGRVEALGVVVTLSANCSVVDVQWRTAEIALRPHPTGRRYWADAKGWFGFAPDVVTRYGLLDLYAEYFPDLNGFDFPAPPAPVPAARSVTSSSSAIPGFVYVIRSDYGFKIGKTVNMKNRTRLFEVKLPFAISVEHYAWFDDYSHAERSFHMQYHAKRLEGEWFDLNPADIAHIKTRGKAVTVVGL
ncbi:MAG: GIY-YIG nuclease family protein [Pseudomonas sp.]